MGLRERVKFEGSGEVRPASQVVSFLSGHRSDAVCVPLHPILIRSRAVSPAAHGSEAEYRGAGQYAD
jgi:hypothetical protein